MDLLSRMLRDLAGDRALIQKLMPAFEQAIAELVTQLQAGLDRISSKLQEWLNPIIEAATAIAEAVAAGNGPQSLASLLAVLFPKLIEAIDGLKSEALIQRVRELAELAEDALGLKTGLFQTWFDRLADAFSDNLTADYLAGDTSPLAKEAFMVGYDIRQIQNQLKAFIQSQDFHFDFGPALNSLEAKLNDLGWDEKLESIRSLVDSVGGVAEAASSILGTFSVAFNPPPTGPLDPISWYATWFEGDWLAIPVQTADRYNVTTEPWYPRMAFKHVDFHTLEDVALASAVIADGLESVAQFVGLRRAPYVSNVVNGVLQLLKGVYTFGMSFSNDQTAAEVYKVLGSNIFEYGFSFAVTWLTSSREGNLKARNNGLYYATSFLQDFGSLMFYANYALIIRESILSILTLHNTDAALSANTDNHEKVLGLAMMFGDIGTWIGATFTGRSNYGFPFNNGVPIGYMFLSLIPTMGLSLIALAFPKAVADKEPSALLVGKILVQNGFMGLARWWMYSNLMWEGNTDGGKFEDFNGYPGSGDSPYLLPFPENVTMRCVQGNLGLWSHNPGKGQTYSFDFSHDQGDEVLAMRDGIVHYWTDFVNDNSSRTDNRVVLRHSTKLDSVIGAAHDQQNFSYVLGHDRFKGGVTMGTFAKYLHGRQYCVRDAFALRGVIASKLRGTPVQQGDLIMFAGNTGMSGHNHLHINLVVDANTINAPTLPFVFRDVSGDGVPHSYHFYKSTNKKGVRNDSIPLRHPLRHESKFISHEVNIVIGAAGIFSDRMFINFGAIGGALIEPEYLQFNGILADFQIQAEMPGGIVQARTITEWKWDSGHWVATLDQAWTTNPSATARFEIISGVSGAGPDHVILDAVACRDDDHYKGCFIILKWKEAGRVFKQCRKITEYKGGDRKATVDHPWDIVPIVGAEIEISAHKFSESNDFEKNFCYLAPYTFPGAGLGVYNKVNTGNISNDPLRPYATLVRTAIYNSPETGTATAGTPNTITLAGTASTAVDAYKDRSIAIVNAAGEVLDLQFITAYPGAGRVATIAGTWKVPITNTTLYQIGAPKYDSATAEQKSTLSFWAKVALNGADPVLDPQGMPTVQDFDATHPPLRYLTYKTKW